MLFDINGGEWIILLLVAALVIGPARLPGYAEQLGKLVRRGRVFLREAKARVDEELGDEAKDVDWASLDPRRYDPRRIVREALLDDPTPPVRPVTKQSASTPATTAVRGGAAAAAVPAVPVSPPFDDEAT
ncbi:twin-arginine translocase TatA/TatE family subunit [Cellulomonas sp. McL0617]|uniref:twin-arginine translocase TatA/TatE family subunit n=1 Tax=Cellulomonas sp. McL0617 TaxID=3415675 RepID=UPI003CF4F9CD